MLRAADGGTLVDVRAVPRASRSRIDGVREDALLVHLAAAPVDGDANRELVEVLAGALGVPKRDVTVARGEHGRRKTVRVAGLTPQDVRARLGVPA